MYFSSVIFKKKGSPFTQLWISIVLSIKCKSGEWCSLESLWSRDNRKVSVFSLALSTLTGCIRHCDKEVRHVSVSECASVHVCVCVHVGIWQALQLFTSSADSCLTSLVPAMRPLLKLVPCAMWGRATLTHLHTLPNTHAHTQTHTLAHKD